MKKKQLGAALVAVFCVLAVVLALVWHQTRPETVTGEKAISVEVVHSDGSIADFNYQTDAEYLSEVLLKEGLIEGSESSYGLYVETVDGETADYTANGSYWWLSVNGEDAQTGADGVAVHDGDQFTWTYTIG
jgi:hypothetical protein